MAHRLLLVAALIFVSWGCGPSLEERIVGRWAVDTEDSGFPSASDPFPTVVQAAIMASTLDIGADGTFRLTSLQTMKGRWELIGNQLVLKPEGDSRWEAVFRERGQGVQLVVDGEGTRLSLTIPTGAGPANVVFRKAG
jgi:hypothetical protein